MLEKDSDPTLKGHPEEISARPKIRVCFRPAQTHWKFGQNWSSFWSLCAAKWGCV